MTDINLYNYYEGSNGLTIDDSGKTLGRNEPNPSWSDTLKYTSQLTDFRHQIGVVYGGKEDCADINNRCRNLRLSANEWHAQGRYVFTVKGGSAGITLAGHIVNGGTRADVVIGDHSDQSSDPTTGVRLCLTKRVGPVRVRVLNGDKPILDPFTGPYQYIWPHPDGWLHGFWSWLYTRF